MEGKKEEITEKPIFASPKYDPGCRDLFNCVKKNIDSKRGETMDNLKVVPNDKGLVVSKFPEDYPATDHLFEILANYKVADHKRNYALIIEDMQYAYEPYVKYCVPHVKQLVETFREFKLPILWTNWARTSEDGYYGALDRFYGPQGIDQKMNPCYVYGDNAYDTLAEIAPQNNDEISRSVVSLHLSKFGDYDEEGREIVFPMLDAWGVNTIVLCGAWTDDCLAPTIFDAVDKYGYDVIVVNNGCATATIHGQKMMDVLYAAVALEMSAEQLVDHLKSHPELIDTPRAPLRGDVRHTMTKYRYDHVIKENAELKEKVKELEEKLKAS